MRVPEENRVEVIRLIQEQALAYKQWDPLGESYAEHFVNTERLNSLEERANAEQRFITSSTVLKELLDITRFRPSYEHKTGETYEVRRVIYMTAQEAFPAEWRLDAYRSYMPEEIPAILEEWESYLQAVRQGHYRAYLLETYLWHESRNAHDYWAEMQAAVKMAEEKDDGWAKHIISSELPEQIRAFPEPVTYSLPRWSEWKDNPSCIEYQSDTRYIELRRTTAQLHQLRFAWNRFVPPIWVLSMNRVPFSTTPFESSLESFNDGDDLFAWLRECVVDNVGLYLWA
jgi:hypothetical protein